MYAKMLELGEEVEIRTLSSQHEQEFTLVKNGFWVIAWDKETTALANAYFRNNGIKKDQNMIVDTSQIPSGIYSMFVAPKMQAFNHPILLSKDAQYNLTLPYKEFCLTVLHIQEGRIDSISFVESYEALKKLLQ